MKTAVEARASQILAFAVVVLLGACSTPAEQAAPTVSAGETAATLTDTDAMRATSGEFGVREDMPGAALYQTHCANCHNGTVPKAPHQIWLEMMTPKTLLTAMNDGIMRPQAASLSPKQRQQIAEYLTLAQADSGPGPAVPWCDDRSIAANTPPAPIGWGHDTRRHTPLSAGGIPRAQAADLALKWSFVYPDALRARSQPAVGWNTVYSGSQDGTVYAFDLDTGCVKWTFEAAAEVRTGIVLTTEGPPLALFGDILAKVYAVNALSGELVWSRKADDHPSATLTGTPAYHGGTLYVPVSSLEVTPAADPAYPCCTFRGNVLALNSADGAQRWRHYTIPQTPTEVGRTRVGTPVLAPSGAPVWSSPTIDVARNRLYIGTGENYSSP
ncbi:MAG: PQQ-binding-like beta-propeller repeat protein, partial [Pseudomonadota bacterium]